MQVLLLGGHGKVALHLTPLLLARAWHVTSVIRNPDHESEILALAKGANAKGKLDVLISSLDEIKTEADAAKILADTDPDYVVWSAGSLPSPLTTSSTPRNILFKRKDTQ
jgi:nucleoside-diphosphate-sugar epimerase